MPYSSSRLDEGLKAFREQRRPVKSSGTQHPADIDRPRELSWYHNDVGYPIMQTGRLAEAMQEYEELRRYQAGGGRRPP